MKLSIGVLILVASISLCYYFIVRPIQNDKKLEDCLSVPIKNNVGTEKQISDFEDYCFKKYGKNN